MMSFSHNPRRRITVIPALMTQKWRHKETKEIRTPYAETGKLQVRGLPGPLSEVRPCFNINKKGFGLIAQEWSTVPSSTVRWSVDTERAGDVAQCSLDSTSTATKRR